MKLRPSILLPLAAAALLAGCGGTTEGSNPDEADGVIPGGAIPAATDVRPGTESAPGNVMPAGGSAGPDAATTPSSPEAAAGQPGAAPADTAR